MRGVLVNLCAEAAHELRVLGQQVRVELLSGLVKRTAKQLDEIRADITAGRVQVAVGTHGTQVGVRIENPIKPDDSNE